MGTTDEEVKKSRIIFIYAKSRTWTPSSKEEKMKKGK